MLYVYRAWILPLSPSPYYVWPASRLHPGSDYLRAKAQLKVPHDADGHFWLRLHFDVPDWLWYSGMSCFELKQV